jgi:hypothetical protein
MSSMVRVFVTERHIPIKSIAAYLAIISKSHKTGTPATLAGWIILEREYLAPQLIKC